MQTLNSKANAFGISLSGAFHSKTCALLPADERWDGSFFAEFDKDFGVALNMLIEFLVCFGRRQLGEDSQN